MTDWNAMSDADFRKEVRQFFEAEYPEELRHLPHRPKFAEIEHWHRKLHAKGWVAPAWPAEYGGMGLDAAKLLIFYEEQQRWGVNRGRDMGVQMVGPLIIKFGTQEQKDYWLPRILSCEDIWCQGYSEPGAGSDLANLRTRAKIDGDDFVINGQKIWTTMAHDATHIFMLVRTDPDAPKKQQGISFVLAPMDQPGVEVRTITTLSGETEFCEVFFDNARTPRENLVGELNKGWTMAKALLSFERIFIGSPSLAQNALGQLESFARGRGAFDDPVFRDRFAQAALDVEDHAALYARFADQLKRGETLGADVSMLKIWVTECFQRITELMIEAAGPDGGTIGPLQVGNVSVDVLASFYKARPTTIYGGSNEIQRNILSNAVLGLPGRTHTHTHTLRRKRTMSERYAKYDKLKFDYPADRVLRITFDRPESFNSVDAETHTQMTDMWIDIDRDPDINAVIVTGAGKAFSAGGDFSLIESMIGNSNEIMKTWKEAKDLVYNIINCNKPIISAINGPAAGAGLVVGILADISIAGKRAKIVDGHPRLGVAAGDVAAIIWPLLTSMAKAKYYLMTCKPVSGEEAERIGLVSMCVEDDELQQIALDTAVELANGSQSAIRWTKYSLNNWLRQAGPIFDASTALEMLGFMGEDVKEGVLSHREKRAPNFRKDCPL